MASIKDFIQHISKDQVLSWWINIAPSQAPDDAIKNNWKYSLIKNEKKLPFKWSIIEIAKYYNYELRSADFNSDNNTRDLFCIEYDFEIEEELVYDNTELAIFKEYYNKRISNKILFQKFISYYHSIIINNQIKAYKIRTAITSKNEIMLLIGMKAILTYKDKENSTEVGFIASKEIYEQVKYQLAYDAFEFKGTYNNYFLTFEITKWEDLPIDIIMDNRKTISLEYSVFKDSNKSIWNEQANTTNSVIKYLIYKNEKIENIIPYKTSISNEFEIWLDTFQTHLSERTKRIYNENIVNYFNKQKHLIDNYLFSFSNYSKIIEDVQLYRNNTSGFERSALSMFTQFLKEKIFVEKNETNMNKQSLNQILYGPPGTGKTYNTINKALQILNFDFTNKTRLDIKKAYDDFVQNGQIVFCTFHQSMSYEDFIEGIKPVFKENLNYDIQDGIFKNIAEVALSNYKNAKNENNTKIAFEIAFEQLKLELEEDSEMKFPLTREGYEFTIIGFTNSSIQFKKASGGTGHTLSINTLRELYYGANFNFKQGVGIYYPSILNKLYSYSNDENIQKSPIELKPYIIIIDEINRGNISQIFGELITLIEEDKRIGEKEEIEIILPYSKSKFGVPPNLYIIGTMNTADRSVEALDIALRRRFVFDEILPNPSIIKDEGIFNEWDNVDLVQLLNTINKRIEILLDKDHQIGHAFFMNIETINDLIIVFKNKIIPLLQEYFYGDYAKIGLLLGKTFITKSEGHINFAEFNLDDISIIHDYQQKSIFSFTESENWDFASIYTNAK